MADDDIETAEDTAPGPHRAIITFKHDHDCAYAGVELHREVIVADDGALALPHMVCADYESHHTRTELVITHIETDAI